MITRESYFSQLEAFKDKQIIKVITGIRRCGKSFLMNQFIQRLKNSGIRENQIIYFRLDDLENEYLLDYKVLHSEIKSKLNPETKNYIFIDEIQLCENFQKTIDSLFNLSYVDIYITGSNSKMLSGELATLLSGRYVTIAMQPFSFSEYLIERKDQNLPTENMQQCYEDYVRFGSFPFTVSLQNSEENIHQYLGGVYHTILIKDIANRYIIKDISILESVIKYIFSNTANICTSKKIADTLTSGGRKVSQPTVENYMQYLEDCFMVYKVQRYDIKGKEILKSLCKYYITDTGLRNTLLGYRNIDSGHILENLIFLELKRRKYQIYTGKADNEEIDFVIKNQNEIAYIQVAETVKNPETLEREFRPFRKLKDKYPCFLITLDKDFNKDYEGIKSINAIDFLEFVDIFDW